MNNETTTITTLSEAEILRARLAELERKEREAEQAKREAEQELKRQEAERARQEALEAQRQRAYNLAVPVLAEIQKTLTNAELYSTQQINRHKASIILVDAGFWLKFDDNTKPHYLAALTIKKTYSGGYNAWVTGERVTMSGGVGKKGVSLPFRKDGSFKVESAVELVLSLAVKVLHDIEEARARVDNNVIVRELMKKHDLREYQTLVTTTKSYRSGHNYHTSTAPVGHVYVDFSKAVTAEQADAIVALLKSLDLAG